MFIGEGTLSFGVVTKKSGGFVDVLVYSQDSCWLSCNYWIIKQSIHFILKVNTIQYWQDSRQSRIICLFTAGLLLERAFVEVGRSCLTALRWLKRRMCQDTKLVSGTDSSVFWFFFVWNKSTFSVFFSFIITLESSMTYVHNTLLNLLCLSNLSLHSVNIEWVSTMYEAL